MPQHPTPADFQALYFRSALGRFPTGVTVVVAENPDTGTPIGLTISSFTSVSLEPPMVLWTLTHTASSLESFHRLERYTIHVLSASQVDLARRFAHGPQTARFEGVPLARAPNGTLMLDDPNCSAWFECFNLQRYNAGDHMVLIGQVEHCQRATHAPLIYHAGDFELTPATESLSRN